MDRRNDYRALIVKAISESYYYRLPSQKPGIETLFFRDDLNGQYMLYATGWNEQKHVSDVIIVARVKDNKIWIDADWTEEGIATDLLRWGVPPADIVLAFHHPSLREEPEPILVG